MLNGNSLTHWLQARPEDYIQGEVIHKMAARAVIRDLEEGTSYQHSLTGVEKYVDLICTLTQDFVFLPCLIPFF
jgi:hypothetical protein